ncbi:MAG: CsgG/HfaB family protein [Verrucomicrobiota bacterium]
MISLKRLLFPVLIALCALVARAENPVLTVAVFDFESRDEGMKDLGPKAATLVNAYLSAEGNLITVERAELEKALGEQELGLSGTVSPETAAKVGNLTGAKVLVTGRIFKVDKETMMVAKIIGTETSRVYGEVVKGAGAAGIDGMAGEMAKKIAKVVEQKGETLVAKVETRDQKVERLKKSLKGDKRPVVFVKITEMHFGARTIDPAAETEMSYYLKESGFALVDANATLKPELEFIGEAFSEYGMRKGNLVSCRARVELKVIEKATGKLLVVDRQTSVGVDLSEQTAAKTALQSAAAELALRVIPKVAK